MVFDTLSLWLALGCGAASISSVLGVVFRFWQALEVGFPSIRYWLMNSSYAVGLQASVSAGFLDEWKTAVERLLLNFW
jgi:hypothetical protein